MAPMIVLVIPAREVVVAIGSSIENITASNVFKRADVSIEESIVFQRARSVVCEADQRYGYPRLLP
jgi:hypothetical protein